MKITMSRIVSFFFIIATSTLWSQEWQLEGLVGEKIQSIEFIPGQDSIFYAGSSSNYSDGTYGDLFRTENGGQTFDTLLTGVTIWDIEVSQINPDIVYCAMGGANFTRPGIMKTIDGGSTWFWADSGIAVDWETGVQDIELDPFSVDTLYAGTGGFFGGSAYRSVDGGSIWENIGDIHTGEIYDDNITAFAAHPYTPGHVIVATYGVGTIYKSRNYGTDWELLIDLEAYEAAGIEDIVFDPHNPDNLFAAFYQSGVLRSTDSGTTWSLANSGLYEDRAIAFSINPMIENQIVVGTYEAGIFISQDNGDSWTTLNDSLQNTWITSVSHNPSGTMLYCGTYDGLFSIPLSPTATESHYNTEISENYNLNCFPNPFNTSIQINFYSPYSTIVTISLFNLKGQEIIRDNLAVVKSTTNELLLDLNDIKGTSLSTGIYIVSIISESHTESMKICLIQ